MSMQTSNKSRFVALRLALSGSLVFNPLVMVFFALTVGVFSVVDGKYGDDFGRVINAVENSVVADAEAPVHFGAGEFLRLSGPGIGAEMNGPFPDVLAEDRMDFAEVFFDGGLELKPIRGHVSSSGPQIGKRGWNVLSCVC